MIEGPSGAVYFSLAIIVESVWRVIPSFPVSECANQTSAHFRSKFINDFRSKQKKNIYNIE